MREIITFIEIEAPPHRVWTTLTDFSAHPDWNPAGATTTATPTTTIQIMTKSLRHRYAGPDDDTVGRKPAEIPARVSGGHADCDCNRASSSTSRSRAQPTEQLWSDQQRASISIVEKSGIVRTALFLN
jgi:hypothetical protein